MRYEKYKDCAVEWIGEIPENWTLKKLKFLSDITTGNRDTVDAVEGGKYPFFVRSENIESIDTYSFDGVGIFTAGDGDIGKIVHFFMGKCDFHQRVYCIYNIRMNERYLYYFFSEHFKIPAELSNSKSTVNSIRLPVLKNFVIPIPNDFEQENIARYLDYKTSKIDLIIKFLEEQKEKLELYKRELIAEVVTKGLDKNIPTKDSGVDWIGQVPEHWGIERIKWNFEIVKRQDGREERPVLSITQQGIKIKDIDKNDGQMAESYEKYQLVEVGDYAMNSMDLLTGWIDCSKYEGVTSPDYRVFRLKNTSNHNREYFNYLFQMCYTRRIFYRLGQGVSNLGRWRLQREPFLNIEIPIPPKEEQEEISAYLFQKESEIKKLKDKIQLQIEKLRDYRKIVIHDAVTGKINVSGGEF